MIRRHKRTRYSIKTDISHGSLEVVDVPAAVAACREKWFNQTLVRVNDSVIRLGILRGEFHWHKHENDDEFFFVLSGRLAIQLEDRTIELDPGQGVVVPKGTMHRPRAARKTVVLMVETSKIEPEGVRRRSAGKRPPRKTEHASPLVRR